MRQIPESSPSSDNSSSPGREAVGVATISVVNDFPEDLYEALRRFVSAHPSWDQYRVMQVAVAGFLFQQGSRERAVARHYLDGLFDRAAAAEGPAPQLQGPALAGVLPPVAQEGPGRPAVSPSQGEGHGPHPAPSPCLAPASAGLLRRQGAPLPPHRLR
jgi:Protein of unknown function (DUF2811)